MTPKADSASLDLRDRNLAADRWRYCGVCGRPQWFRSIPRGKHAFYCPTCKARTEVEPA